MTTDVSITIEKGDELTGKLLFVTINGDAFIHFGTRHAMRSFGEFIVRAADELEGTEKIEMVIGG